MLGFGYTERMMQIAETNMTYIKASQQRVERVEHALSSKEMISQKHQTSLS